MVKDNETIDENAKELPPVDETQQETDVPVVSGVTDTQPITTDELYEIALHDLHYRVSNDPSWQKRADVWYRTYFGENYTTEDVCSGLNDERQESIVTEYILDVLSHGIKSSGSLERTKISEAFNRMFSLVGYAIEVAGAEGNAYDPIFKKRAGNIDLLQQSYKALKINRELAEVCRREKSITNVEHLTSKMEKLASAMRNSSADNIDARVINNEVMAQFYYNVSVAYEGEANIKNNLPEINKWEYRSLQYKKKALDLTSSNIELVSDIQKTWRNYGDYDIQKITDACERIIDNHPDEHTLYSANKLYAETKASAKTIDIFNGREDRFNDAILHYRIAMKHTDSSEDKKDILNKISDIQKLLSDKIPYIQTRLEYSDLMTGKQRIRERFKIIDDIENKELKIAVLKSCITEFDELKNVTDEDRLLYNKLDTKIRTLISPDDTKTLKKLNKLKEKHGLNKNTKSEFMFLTMSSSGKDIF